MDWGLLLLGRWFDGWWLMAQPATGSTQVSLVLEEFWGR